MGADVCGRTYNVDRCCPTTRDVITWLFVQVVNEWIRTSSQNAAIRAMNILVSGSRYSIAHCGQLFRWCFGTSFSQSFIMDSLHKVVDNH